MRPLRVLSLLTLLASPRAAGAQTADVVRLLREGVAHRLAGRDELALDRFTTAHALCRCAEAGAQIGLAAQALGRFAAAEPWLAEALAAQGDRWVIRNRAELEAALDFVRARSAILVLNADDRASVRVDDADRGEVDASRPLSLRLDAGPHRVAFVTRDGRRAEEAVVLLASRQSALRVVLPPRAAPPLGAPVRVWSERPSVWRRAAPWVAVAGAAGAAAGAVAFAFERQYSAIWESPDCLAGGRTREENCAPWRIAAERAETATVVSWAVGAALLAAAAGSWWLAPRTTRSVSLRCAPTGSAGLVCGGSF